MMKNLWRKKSFAKAVKEGVGRAARARMRFKKYRDIVAQNGRIAGAISMKKNWKDEKFVKAHLKRLRKLALFPTKPQLDFRDRLRKDGIKYLRLEYRVGRRLLDIACLPLKLDIEIDGPNFHQNPEKDKKRDVELKALGWKTIRVRLKGNKFSEKDYKKVLLCLRNS